MTLVLMVHCKLLRCQVYRGLVCMDSGYRRRGSVSVVSSCGRGLLYSVGPTCRGARAAGGPTDPARESAPSTRCSTPLERIAWYAQMYFQPLSAERPRLVYKHIIRYIKAVITIYTW